MAKFLGHLLEFARLSNDQRATSCLEGKLRRSWPAELPKARPLTETVDAAQKLMERERRQAKHAALAKWRDRMRTNGTALTAWLKRKWQPLPHTFWRVVGGQRLVASSYAHALGFIVAFWHDIWDRDVQCPAVEALGQVTTAATPMEGSWRLNVKEVAAAARQCQGAPGPDGRQPDELSQLPDHAFAWFIELWERWVERQVFHFPEVWQHTRMVMILKKIPTDGLDIADLGPISVQCLLARVLSTHTGLGSCRPSGGRAWQRLWKGYTHLYPAFGHRLC